MSNAKRKISVQTLAWLVALAVFVVDRVRWPLVACWREDEATVMWIGRHYGVLDFTVGLTSSTSVPNPNALLWVGKLISFAPDLYWSGVMLQLLHLAVLFAVCRAVGRRVSFGAGFALFVLLGSLLAYRSSGSEPWSQWLMLPATLSCLVLFLACVNEPSFARFFGVLAMLWIFPALYIAGLLNAFVFAAALAGVLARSSFRRRLFASRLRLPLLAFVAWSALQLLLVWKPYFSVVSIADLRQVSSAGVGERIQRAALEIVRAPLWVWDSACSPDFAPSLFVDTSIVSYSWFALLGDATQWLLRLLIVLGAVVGIRARIWRRTESRPWVFWPLALLWLALVLSPLLGGPALSLGERPDIGFQWVPLVLLPLAVVLGQPEPWRPLRVGLRAVALSFALLQMVAGFVAFGAYERYRGDVLTATDVPIRQKMAVVDAIVDEARTRALGNEVPIQYEVGGGRWDWIKSFQTPSLKPYGSPYTLGRTFDYDLDRRYGMRNTLTGSDPRQPTWGFWVNYAFESPLYGAPQAREIGRLRLGYRDPPSKR